MEAQAVRVGDRTRLSEQVAERLVQLIATGALKPGDSLPAEAELARQFNVSKSTVREALNQLAVYGIVQIQQGKATTIRPLSAAPLEGFFKLAVRSSDTGLRDALELRRAIETEIAELAAERATLEGLRELESAYRRMEANVDSIEPWLEADFAFHMALARNAGNVIMLHAITGLRDVMRYTMRLLGVQTDLRSTPATLARHKAVLDAVLARDPAAARAAMRHHFDATKPVVMAISGDKSRLARL